MTPDSRNCSLSLILEIPRRKIYHIRCPNPTPAVFFIDDKEVGGILVNTPAATTDAKTLLSGLTVDYIFYPSHLGARSPDQWRELTGARLLAHENECAMISADIDIPLSSKTKLSRTMDFVPIAGRTQGSCALFIKNLPGVIFFGPVLQRGTDGWPTLIPQMDDHDFESRLIAALGIKDLKFQYALLDDFDPEKSKTGPGAADVVCRNIEQLFEE